MRFFSFKHRVNLVNMFAFQRNNLVFILLFLSEMHTSCMFSWFRQTEATAVVKSHWKCDLKKLGQWRQPKLHLFICFFSIWVSSVSITGLINLIICLHFKGTILCLFYYLILVWDACFYHVSSQVRNNYKLFWQTKRLLM